MINSDFLGSLAYSLWLQIGMPSDISYQSISGYFCSNETVGQLNNLTAGCWCPSGFTGVGSWNFDIWGPFSSNSGKLYATEGELLGKMYLINYYSNQINKFIGGGTFISGVNTQNLPVTMLKEGDSVIQYMDPAKAAAILKTLRDEAVKDLRYAANTYNQNSQGASTPLTNAFYNIAFTSFNGPWVR